ncbi:hypothetical protein [Nocardioides zeae]
MGTTSLGLWFPDRSTPMSLHAIVKQAQESTDTFLAPQTENVAVLSPFLGGLVVLKSGPVVTMTGGIRRDGWTGGSTQVGTLPAGMAPAEAVVSMIGSTRDGAGSYQLSVQSDGRVMYQVSAPSTNTLGVNMSWPVSV